MCYRMNFNCAYPEIRETIPASALGYRTNNRYDGFPPLMNDGRSIMAAHRSEPLLHNSILKSIGTTSNAEYRAYMIKNGRALLEQDFLNASNDVGYTERPVDQLLGNYLPPRHYATVMDSPRLPPSDLKQIYLTREQLESRRMAPRI